MSTVALSFTAPRPCPICGGKPLHKVWKAGDTEHSRCLTHEKTIDGKIERLIRATGEMEQVARNPATGRWEQL